MPSVRSLLPGADAVAPCSCPAGSGTQGDAGGAEIAADGLGMHAEVAADSGAGLVGKVTPLGLTFLLTSFRPRGRRGIPQALRRSLTCCLLMP